MSCEVPVIFSQGCIGHFPIFDLPFFSGIAKLGSNMTTSFARTTHALQAVDFRKSIFGLALVSLLIVLWLAWFMLARITIFEVSASIPLETDELLTVLLPYKGPGQLKRGQVARLHLDGVAGETTGSVPALVTDVTTDLEDGLVTVTMVLFWELVPFPPENEALTGRVEIETEYVSPATLLMRTVNDGLNTYPVRFSAPSTQPANQMQ